MRKILSRNHYQKRVVTLITVFLNLLLRNNTSNLIIIKPKATLDLCNKSVKRACPPIPLKRSVKLPSKPKNNRSRAVLKILMII